MSIDCYIIWKDNNLDLTGQIIWRNKDNEDNELLFTSEICFARPKGRWGMNNFKGYLITFTLMRKWITADETFSTSRLSRAVKPEDNRTCHYDKQKIYFLGIFLNAYQKNNIFLVASRQYFFYLMTLDSFLKKTFLRTLHCRK